MSLQAVQANLWQDYLLDLPTFMDEQKYSKAFETLKFFLLDPKAPEKDVQSSCAYLLQLIPHLNQRRQHELLQAASNKLLHFPALVEERIAVLTCAGDILAQLDEDLDRSLSQASLALHHYTAALALAPREEILAAISRLFSRLSLLQFPELLDRALHGDRYSFEKFVSTIPQRHSCFSSQPEEIQSYYAQVASALVRISPQARQQLGQPSAFVLTELKKLTAPPLGITQRYHQELAKVRAVFTESLSAQEMQEKSFGHFTAFLKLLFEEAMLILGRPPCPFDIRLTGSCARELCPYSDLEYFILIEDTKYRPYFKRLAQFFEMQILILAESGHGYVVPAYSARFGLQINPQSNPARDESLICQPDAFMAKLAVTTDDPEMLKSLTSYVGSYSLFSNRLLGNISVPEKVLQLIEQLNKKQNPLGTTLDLKRDLMAPLVDRLHSLALYHNIPQTNTLRLIDDLPFDDFSKLLLKEAVSSLYLMRVRVHLAQNCSHEIVSVVPSLEFPVLSQKEKELIEVIYHLVITPLYTTKLPLLEINKLWDQVFIVENEYDYAINAINADFKDLQDLEREKLMLRALQYLYSAQKQKPKKLSIRNTAALNFDVLQTLLHPDLKKLDLSYCPEIKDSREETAASWIAMRCPNLKALHLEGCQGIEVFDATFANLKFLNLARCPHLKTITLEIDPSEVRIEHCPELTTVQMPFGNEVRVNWIGAPKAGGNFREIFEAIVRLGEKSKIDLKSREIGAADVEALAEALKVNTSITEIDLGVNQIGDTGAIALAETLKVNSSITKIDLRVNEIGDAGAVALAEALKVNTSITEIYLGSNQIGDAGAIALAEALKVNTSIINISLRGNRFSDTGAVALADALKVNSSITGIFPGMNKRIGVTGAAALAETLKVNFSITFIDLESSQIGDAGAAALADALKVNSSIILIGLENNEIGDAGANSLAEALKINTSIILIILEGNQIGDAGAAALAEVLKVNTSITSIRLADNQIGDAGAAALADALKINTSITHIDLTGNQIGDAGAAALAEALKFNSSITRIQLIWNKISSAGAAVLAEALKVNSSITDISLDKKIDDDLLKSINTFLANNTTLKNNAFQQAHSGNPQFLVDSGVSLYGFDEHQNTFLHITAQNGHVQLVEDLLQRSRNPTFINRKNIDDKTALDLAREHNHQAVVEILLRWGAK